MSNRPIVGGIVLDVWERGLQTFVRIARLGILDGLHIILEFLYGVSPIQCTNLGQPPHRGCSVNCASIHRKIGTHITKVYVAS